MATSAATTVTVFRTSRALDRRRARRLGLGPFGLGGRCGRPPVAVEGRVLLQDRLMQVAERAARLDPELAHERSPSVLVDLERLSLTPRPIEREHELTAQRLSQGLRVDEAFELRDELGRAARLEILLDALLEAREPELLQTLDLRLGEAQVGELRERRASPESERIAKAAVRAEERKLLQVELSGVDVQHVPGGLPLQAVSADDLPQVRDVDLERLLHRLGGRVLPQRVDQAVGGDDSIGLEEQHGQERTVLLSTKVDAAAVLDRLERAEDAELHRSLPTPTGGEAQARA
jgi:hypothetical protein